MPKISETRKDERRRQILQAAVTCFARQGFQKTTILDICAEAGLSAGAIYGYFDSKDAIIEALAEQGRAAAAARSARADTKTAPGDRLRAFVDEFRRPGTAKINQFDVRGWAEAIGNIQLRENYLSARKETLKALRAIAKPFAAARALEAETVAELILATIMGCETRRAIEPSANVVPVLETMIELLQPDHTAKRR